MNEKGMEEKEKKKNSLAAILNCCLYFKCVLKNLISLFPKSHPPEKSTEIGVGERGSRLWNIPFSRVKLL